MVGAAHRLDDARRVFEVGPHQLQAGVLEQAVEVVEAAGDEVVEDDDLLLGAPEQRTCEVAADEARAAGDERANRHGGMVNSERGRAAACVSEPLSRCRRLGAGRGSESGRDAPNGPGWRTRRVVRAGGPPRTHAAWDVCFHIGARRGRGTLSRMPASEHTAAYFSAAARLAGTVDGEQVDAMARGLAAARERGGRLFVLGVGGGAGHASHAVNDFRKLCGLETYAPTDNVSELTARTNDDGWETSFSAWLEVSRLAGRDALMVFSVGGGSREHNVSTNLVRAMEAAHDAGAAIYGVVGAPGGALAELADVAIVLAPPPELRTPLVESFQAVVWHALVSHPALALRRGHWESLAASAAATGAAASDAASA